jgi:two-component system chemotaxis sensor kinase CheA
MFRKQIESVAKSTLSVESVSFLRKMPGDDPDLGDSVNARAKENEPLRGQVYAPPPVQKPAQTVRPAESIAGTRKPPPEPKHIPTQLPEQTAAPLPKTSGAVLLSESDPANALQHTGVPTKQNIITVDLTKLDSLLDLVGEIVINKSMVTENPDWAGIEPNHIQNFNKAARQLGKLTDELRDTVMSVRLVPLQATFQKMRRGVRDMSKSLGKDVELVLLGETTEVDKMIIDAIGDPIMHLVRNAVDHAIELPHERVASGKTPVGHVTISAQNAGSEVIISVSDDGRGIDRERILAKAKHLDMLTKSASEYTDSEIHGFLMAPGFSTNEKTTEYSGRGVGLDVVKMNIERIGGAVVIESAKGVGTNVLMKIPLTLAIIECMELRVGKEIYAIPINNIKESFKSSSGQFIEDPSGKEMMMLRDTVYPVVRLYEKFGIEGAIEDLDEGILLVTDAADRKGCLLVDELVGKWQVAVKGIPDYLKNFGVKSTGIAGCTITGNGNASLILDVRELLS